MACFIRMAKNMPAVEETIAHLFTCESDVLHKQFANPGEDEYRYLPGSLPVLVSAPHGAMHTRDVEKEEDEFTAGLAQLIGARTGAHVLYARRKSHSDPNYTPTNPYKTSLLQFAHQHGIRFVLDLHGAHASRDFGVALGTMHGKSCSPRERHLLIETLERNGITQQGSGLARLDVDIALPAEGGRDRQTVTGFCKLHRLPAAQLEINARLRIPPRRQPDETRQQAVVAMIDTLCQLANCLGQLEPGK